MYWLYFTTSPLSQPVYCSCYLKFAQSGPKKGLSTHTHTHALSTITLLTLASYYLSTAHTNVHVTPSLSQSTGQFVGIVALCKLASTSKIREMVVGTFFKSKHSLDLSYKSLDRRCVWKPRIRTLTLVTMNTKFYSVIFMTESYNIVLINFSGFTGSWDMIHQRWLDYVPTSTFIQKTSLPPPAVTWTVSERNWYNNNKVWAATL